MFSAIISLNLCIALHRLLSIGQNMKKNIFLNFFSLPHKFGNNLEMYFLHL